MLGMKSSLDSRLRRVFSLLKEKPLSTLSALGAALVMLYSAVTILHGSLYIGVLNHLDATTLIMTGFLWLRAIFAMRERNDLQTFSLALVSGLSFIFAYEAIYKASFYANPSPASSGLTILGRAGSHPVSGVEEAFFGIPPAQLREGVLDIAIALTVLVGFAYGVFSFSKYSKLCVLLFAASWAVWLTVGFPQINDLSDVHPPVINLQLNWLEVYLLNRETKFLLFLAYFFLFKKNNSAVLDDG